MATVVWYLQRHFGISLASGGVLVGFGMVFAGDISDVMSDGEKHFVLRRANTNTQHPHLIFHLAKQELAVPFFCTNIYYIVYIFTQIASFLKNGTLRFRIFCFFRRYTSDTLAQSEIFGLNPR